jgi:hypothetical protein
MHRKTRWIFSLTVSTARLALLSFFKGLPLWGLKEEGLRKCK